MARTPSGTEADPTQLLVLATALFEIEKKPLGEQATSPLSVTGSYRGPMAFAGVTTNDSNDQINAKIIARFLNREGLVVIMRVALRVSGHGFGFRRVAKL
jgi:hypothetical protein